MTDRLRIRDGGIDFFLYQQDGTKQPWRVRDTLTNRQFVEWVQIHDSPLSDGVIEARKKDRKP